MQEWRESQLFLPFCEGLLLKLILICVKYTAIDFEYVSGTDVSSFGYSRGGVCDALWGLLPPDLPAAEEPLQDKIIPWPSHSGHGRQSPQGNSSYFL